ncbi:MAG TPA: hypothetical protein VFT74_18835 [Isosphaeraceae bacterium]|nr:hypothetical protein [Isosphaeraceae bacterium]
MSRCFSCCQENCGYGACSCSCHKADEVPKVDLTKPKLTKTQYVSWAISGREVQTATEIYQSVMSNFSVMPGKPTISLATVSSILNRFVKQGLVGRVAGFGKRGGYGYVLTRKGFEKIVLRR